MIELHFTDETNVAINAAIGGRQVVVEDPKSGIKVVFTLPDENARQMALALTGGIHVAQSEADIHPLKERTP